MIELDPKVLHLHIDSIIHREGDLELEDLKADIAKHGQKEPVNVMKEDGKYWYVFGTRRIEACRELGIKVKCIVRERLT